MPQITKEQAQNLLNKGYSRDQVVAFMKQAMTQGTSKGVSGSWTTLGQDVSKNFGTAIRDTGEAAGVAANTALLGIPEIVSQATTGGKFTGKAYPIIRGGKNVFAGNDLPKGIKTEAEMAGAVVPVGEGLSLIAKTPAAKVIGGIFKYGKADEQAKLAETVRTAAYQAKTDAVNQFGDSIDALSKSNPDRVVSLRNMVEGINQNMAEMAPEAKAVLRKTPILKDLLDDPISAASVKLEDAQKIINYIGTKVPKTIKANHLEIIDALNDTRAAQLDAFPEMANVRAKYGDFKNAFDTIKGKLKKGALIDNMAKDFGDAEIQKSARQVFNEDMLNQVKKFQQAKQVLKAAGIVSNYALKGAATVAGGGALYEGGKKLFGE